MTFLNEKHIAEGTVDGRNPKQPPGMYKKNKTRRK